MNKGIILLLSSIILGMIFFVPPFHGSVVLVLLLLVATLCGFVVTFATKKRKVGIIAGSILFLILTLHILQVLTPLNILLVFLLGASLLTL